MLAVAGIGVASLGYYLLKGVIAHIVVARREGVPAPALGEVAPRLPYLTMIATDIILAAGVGVGTELLVVPGVLFGAYFGLAPIVVEVEHKGVFASLRRSAELVRGHFWMVAVIMFGTLLGVALLSLPLKALADALLPAGTGDYVYEAVGLLVAGILVKPIGAVASVELTLELIADAEPR